MTQDKNGKTPFQEDKKEKVEEILDKQNQDEKPAKNIDPATGKRKYTRKKSAIPVQEYTEENANLDASFMVDMVNEFRTGSGLPKMRDNHQMFFAASSKAMFLKYGSSAAKWMPETMFIGSLSFIMLDTYKEIKILKAKQPEKETKKSEVKKPEVKKDKK